VAGLLPYLSAMKHLAWILVAACGGGTQPATSDAPAATDGDISIDAPPTAPLLGTVTDVRDLPSCPQGAPPQATCKQVTVTGCPGLETESIDAIVAIRAERTTRLGTVVHFSGGGGDGFQGATNSAYANAGYRTVHVAWRGDWEQTQSLGIKAAGCRPATILKWAFDEPAIHGGDRSTAFCGEGFSGGSGQLGYALAHYGLGDYLDYVNELSGPPFGRIDLGCDGDAPATATVCGATVTTVLPPKVTAWENIASPLTCGSTSVPSDELARWKDDSVASGGTYVYPKTRVEFFACTNQATAVTALGRAYFDTMAAADASNTAYHCYSAADGCQGEGLGTGNRDATDALLAGCVPHHE